MAIQNDPDLRRDPGRLAILTGLVARRVVARRLAPGTTFRSVVEGLYEDFVPGGDVKRALASITVPVLYMPSATDLCFPVDDARYGAGFMPHVTLIDSLALGSYCRRGRQPG